jgi:hypothetical protein
MYSQDWVGTMPSGAIQAGNIVHFKADSGEGYFVLKYLSNCYKEKASQMTGFFFVAEGGLEPPTFGL